jgi:alpha-galactosidase/6-phospho-beta-glucosidase family protein
VQALEALAATWTAPGADPVTLADLPVGDEDEGIEVIDVIEAIVRNGNITRVVVAPNRGAIPNLPDDAIVEVNAQINAYGVRPIHTGPLPEALAAHLRHYVSFQQQVVRTALSGDRTAALHAFLLDPNTQSHLDLDETQALLDEMLEANREYLPQFER